MLPLIAGILNMKPSLRVGLSLIFGYGWLELSYVLVKGASRLVIVAYILAGLAVILALLLAGRQPDEWRETLINLNVLAFAILLCFGLFSMVYVRLFDNGFYLARHANWGMTVADSTLGYRFKPNIRDRLIPFGERAEPVVVGTDADGYRNDPPTVGAPIAAVGDSFTFGVGVSNEETWVAFLSEELGVPVSNYGVWGYALWNYTQVATEMSAKYDHRMILYGFHASDLDHDWQNLPTADQVIIQKRTYGNPIIYTATRLGEFLRQSPTRQIVEAARQPRLRPQPDVAGDTAPQPDCFPWTYDYDPEVHDGLLRQRLDEAIAASKAGDYQPVFVMLPTSPVIYTDYLVDRCGPEYGLYARREIAGFAFVCDYLSEREIPCYDMRDDFRAAFDPDVRYFYPVDGHFTVDGNRLAARLTAMYLREHDLLPPP